MHRQPHPYVPSSRALLSSLVTAVLTLLPAALLGALLAAPAHAADNGRWSVFPATAKGVAPDERPHFELKADPGDTVRDKVVVSNLAGEPKTFLLYAADAHNTPRDGGFAVRSRDEKQTGVGRWARLARTELTIPAATRATVPFTLKIPGNATPGDHAGAIVAVDKEIAASTEKKGVGVQQGVGARVYLSVSGERQPRLAIEDVTFHYDAPLVPGTGEAATITYRLVNKGNVALEPRVALRAEGLFGRTLLNRAGDGLPAGLLPGEEVELSEKWAGPPMADWGEIELTATEDGRIVGTADTGYSTVNWPVVIGLLLMLAALAGRWLALRRRRRRGGAEPPAEPERVAATTAGP